MVVSRIFLKEQEPLLAIPRYVNQDFTMADTNIISGFAVIWLLLLPIGTVHSRAVA